ncbi:hypothetical protein BKA70DRAFT_1446082 [Coprinopsis sp. MPI-PUGE-AT-0042]|nr:hypothetical protein BKA70DRAFT_1446082 [Coprinopsis sp. MPI-PUGE-AT-0042]
MISKALQAVKNGYTVAGTVVDKPLKSCFLLPIQNTFSTHLGQFGFNIYQSLVVDLMHEFEIGVWKRVYIHLLCLLEAFGKQELITELDEQYRQMPSFGHDTIQKFSENVSDCKRRAARDYEDLLQCSITSFEGLLPSPHTKMSWIYSSFFLASQFRKFQQETCQCVVTVELQQEVQVCVRKTASKAGTSSDFMVILLGSEKDPISMATMVAASSGLSDGGGPLPDRAPSAPLSSGSGVVKTALPRSDGVHSQALPSRPGQGPVGVTTVVTPSSLSDGEVPLPNRVPSAPPSSRSGTVKTALPSAATRREKKFSLSTPKYHALGHYTESIHTYGTTDSFTSEIVKYTTYDVRREADIICLKAEPNVMVLADKTEEHSLASSPPLYRYAQVLGIFHTNIMFVGDLRNGTRDYTPHCINFLWALKNCISNHS